MFNSIRAKLTLWYAGVLALLIIAFAAITYFSIDRILTNETDRNLLEMSKIFVTAASSETEDENLSADETIAEIIKEFKFRDYRFFVFSNDGKVIARTSDEDFSPDFPDDSYHSVELRNQNFRVFSTPLKIFGNNYKLLVCRDLAEQFQIKSRLVYIFLFSVPIVILISVWFGYLLAKRSLKPVDEMVRQSKEISSNNLESRLSVKNKTDEIGTLASVFNDLLERLEDSFERQKRFMADASHELRTPLAIVRGESEVALSKKDRPNDDLRESLAIVNDESKRLTKIVEDLFTLSRADAGQFKANFKQVYLDEILTDCVRNMRVLADKKHLTLEISTEETEISGDESLLRRLFLNLLDNAVKYNRDGGKISVSLTNKTVVIADTGFGIADAERTKIFERFYRSDKARTRSGQSETGGAGLGLAISQWIAELHYADLKLSESDTSGSIFTVIFPR